MAVILSGSDTNNGRTIVKKQNIIQKEVAVETPKEIKIDTEEKLRVTLAAEKLEAELKDVEQMFAASDVAGLVDMLDKGQWETKVAAANYLATMGDLSAINALENLADKVRLPWIKEDLVALNNIFEKGLFSKRRRERDPSPGVCFEDIDSSHFAAPLWRLKDIKIPYTHLKQLSRVGK